MVFLRRFSCDGAARPSATPSRKRRAGVNEDTAETSVLRGLARLNRLSLIWLTKSFMRKAYLISFPHTSKRTYTATRNSANLKKRFIHAHKAEAETKLSARPNSVTL